MPNQLDKILNFVERSGDKAVVFKDDGEFVVMTLSDYESLVRQDTSLTNLSEGELLQKINREIALWRDSQKTPEDKEEKNDFINESPVIPEFNDSFETNIDDKPEIKQFDLPNDDDWQDDDWKMEDDYNIDDNMDDNEKSEHFDENDDITGFKEKSEEIGADDPFNPEEVENKPKSKKKININNFGYSNPGDTNNDIFDKEASDRFKLRLEEKEDDDNDFDHIPPPPDIK